MVTTVTYNKFLIGEVVTGVEICNRSVL